MKHQLYYVVSKGIQVGIYNSYEEAAKYVNRYADHKLDIVKGLNKAYLFLIKALLKREILFKQEYEALKDCMEKYNSGEGLD